MDVVARSVDQRQPLSDEPVCIVCGRYGAYVCDATDEDVCSLECRDKCIQRQENLKRAAILRQKLGITIKKLGDDSDSANYATPMLEFTQEMDGVTLPDELLKNLTASAIEKPTPVQMQTVPSVLQHNNMLVSAPTGTGKTAAYLVPAIAQILIARVDGEETAALVLAPIRELAIQIESVAKTLMKGIANMRTALVVGGFPVPTQRYRLQSGVQLIVATPGRLLDIFTNYDGDAVLSTIRTCIVDEVDMMLDVGFRPQISQIVSLVQAASNERVQMLFFSATVSNEVEALVEQVLKEPRYLRLDVRSDQSKPTALTTPAFSLNASVQHQVRWADEKAKKNKLFAFLEGKQDESTLVFVSSKLGANMLADAIQKRCGLAAASIHADKSQQERLTLLEAFINVELPVLVSTNVLSRGMDLLNVQNVVVYDLPKKLAEYVHLVGRTGRGDDARGTVLTLLNQEDRPLFRDVIPLLRGAKARVPREVYASIHDDAQRAQSQKHVMDQSKRAYRIREQCINEVGLSSAEWKGWTAQSNKRRRTGP